MPNDYGVHERVVLYALLVLSGGDVTKTFTSHEIMAALGLADFNRCKRAALRRLLRDGYVSARVVWGSATKEYGVTASAVALVAGASSVTDGRVTCS